MNAKRIHMKYYLFYTVMILLMAITSSAVAQQDSCIVYLKQANINYENRYYDTAISQLKLALDNCSLKKEDKIQAQKLLALSYLGIDELELASKY